MFRVYNCVIHIVTTLNLYCADYVEKFQFNSMSQDLPIVETVPLLSVGFAHALPCVFLRDEVVSHPVSG